MKEHANQAKWMINTTRVMVATNAFGMGIDKPDVKTRYTPSKSKHYRGLFPRSWSRWSRWKKAFAISLFQNPILKIQ